MADNPHTLATDKPGQPFSKTSFTYDDLQRFARNAGFTPAEAVIAAAIAMSESGGKSTAVNPKSNARGLWQITPANNDVIHGDWRDPQVNANAAYAVYKRQGWSAWTTYGSQSYKNNLAVEHGQSSNPTVRAVTGGVVSSISDFLQLITSPDLWRRIGLGVLGALMLVGGVLIMVSGDAKAITKNLPPVIPV